MMAGQYLLGTDLYQAFLPYFCYEISRSRTSRMPQYREGLLISAKRFDPLP